MSQDYDKDLINREVIAVCDHYLTDKRGEGKRQTYLCPACGDRNFEVDPDRGYAGCFDAGCEAPTTTDALGVIAYFEGKSISGEGFVMCLKKGYEILGIVDPEEEKSAPRASTNGTRQRAMTPRKDRASSHEKAMTPRADRRGGEGVSDNAHGSVNGSGSRWGAATSSPPETPESALLEQPIQAWQENEDGTTVPVAAVVIRESEGTATEDAGEELEDAELAEKTDRKTGQTDERRTAHEVFEELLKLCRREERDESFLLGRGLDEQTIKEGRFGSISKERCSYVVGKLRQKFSDEELLSVPGFRKAENGQFRFSLYGDYALIPYFDNEGYIRTVEGRFTGEEMGEYDKKYKALLNSAVHLYVHPRYMPAEVMAICEGAIGAMVAARYGFAVASIKGFRNYRRRVDGDGNPYTVLPEFEGVDFTGKVVVYIPDVDVKPASYESVMKAVPDACHWMIQRQGGVPKVAMLPEGAKDLDAWILSLDEEEREQEIRELLAQAYSLAEWKEKYLSSEADAGPRGSDEEPEEDLEVGEPEEDTEQTEHGQITEKEDVPEDDSPSKTGAEDETSPSESQLSLFTDGVRPEAAWQGEETNNTDLREFETDSYTQQGDSGPTTDEPKSEGSGQDSADETAKLEAGYETGGSAAHEDTEYETARSTSTETRSAAVPMPNPPGERALVTVVYVLAAIAITIALQAVLGQWLIWIQCAVLGAGFAILPTAGFVRLRRWQLARSLHRHVEGNDV